MRLLVITPHLSTGGMPQYLLKFLETYLDMYSHIKVIEFSNFSSTFVVQKEKIKTLIGEENLITLGEFGDWDNDVEFFRNRLSLLNLIKMYQPDVVYMSGTPECYEYKSPPHEIMQQVYRSDRKYKIIETCHNNSFDFNNKIYIPDEFMFCSESHMVRSTNIDIPKTVWEYPIEAQERPDRAEALRELGLDPSYLHILNVGLIHPNKNQKYIFDLAKKFENQKVQFHFIGNNCFLDSCDISQEDINRSSCKLWGERSDVDKFMSCMDIYLFPSKKELNPLTIKEALSWDMEVIASEDENYTHQYKEYSNFHLISDISVEEFITDEFETKNKKDIRNEIMNDIIKTEGRFLVVSSFYNNTREHILQTFDNIIKQTYKNWVFIVGDDFSDNGCGEMLRDEVKKLNHPNILYYDIKFKRELHLYQNFFEYIDHDYYLDIDSDDILSKDLLKIYNDHFKKFPNVSSIFCDYDVISEGGDKQRISTVKMPSDLNLIDDFHKRVGLSYYGLWSNFHSWNMYGHGRCFRNNRINKFPISKNCSTSVDTFSLFSSLCHGDHLEIPMSLYTQVHRDDSGGSVKMPPEQYNNYNTNALFAIDKYKEYEKKFKQVSYYDDVWLETNALSNSSISKNSGSINLISDINDEQLSKIKFLYQDKDIVLNTALGDNVVIIWNKLNEDQKVKILQLLKDDKYNFTIYNFLDDFNIHEDNMEEYFNKSNMEFFKLINSYIKGYSYFSYFRHVIIDKRKTNGE